MSLNICTAYLSSILERNIFFQIQIVSLAVSVLSNASMIFKRESKSFALENGKYCKWFRSLVTKGNAWSSDVQKLTNWLGELIQS